MRSPERLLSQSVGLDAPGRPRKNVGLRLSFLLRNLSQIIHFYRLQFPLQGRGLPGLHLLAAAPGRAPSGDPGLLSENMIIPWNIIR